MPGDLPTGTVTFLFSDIEGSTRLWEERPGDMSPALERHDVILRDAASASSGYVFTTAGDSFAVAFHRPADAVAMALQSQAALAGESFAGRLEIRARMGIHAGSADERDGDYFGQTPTRTARIMSAAHGGQVLLSEAVVALLDDLEVVDLGEHRLRDLGDPIRLFELGSESTTSFPAIRSLNAIHGNLPLQVSSFVGRDTEVEALAGHLEEQRLVTLVGVGGTGKTRLAIHTAAEVGDRFDHGTWLIELGQLRSEGGIDELVLSTMGAGLGTGQSPRERLIEFLSGQRVLLVLDNCEHLLDAVASMTIDLLQRCAAVSVLATSREPLLVSGEQLVAVGSLAVDVEAASGEALQLFLDRARTEGAAIDTTSDVLAVVAEICRRLDGMPLAIELAAARARSLDVAEILRHLDERFRLLTGGRRSSAERHQTLRATVAWSYDLLSPLEQAVFDRLSVFAGSFDVDAAAVVCSEQDVDALDTIDAIATLVDKSMCVRHRDEGIGQYRLLETLRAFGRENLTGQGAVDRYSERHARHFATLARSLNDGVRGLAEEHAARDFERNAPELRAAVEWAAGADTAEIVRFIADASWPFMWRGFYTPAAWFADIEDQIDRQDWLLDWLIFQAFFLNDRKWGADLAAYLDSHEPDGTSDRIGAHVFASFSAVVTGDLDAASHHAGKASQMSVHAASRFDAVMGEFTAAAVPPALGQDVRTHAQAMIERAEHADWITGQAFGHLAVSMNSELSDPSAALAELQHAADLAASVGSREVVGLARMRMVPHMLDLPRSEAAQNAGRAIDQWVAMGNWINFRATAQYAIALLVEAGRSEAAVRVHGYLDGFVGNAPPAIQQRMDEALSAAIDAVGDGAAALLEGGRSLTNAEMGGYLADELRSLRQDP